MGRATWARTRRGFARTSRSWDAVPRLDAHGSPALAAPAGGPMKRFAVATASLAALLALAAAAPARADGNAPGGRLDDSNWQDAKDLLPPEILEHYKDGKFASPIGTIPDGDYALDKTFLDASVGNDGKFKLDEHGSLVDAATGKPPEYNFGAPFPKLDRD